MAGTSCSVINKVCTHKMYCYLLYVLVRYAISSRGTLISFFLKNSFLYPFVKSRKYFLLEKEAYVLIYTIKITDYQLFSCVGRPLACSAIVGSISTLLFVPFETLISKYFIIELTARKRISEGKIVLRLCFV